MDLNFDKLQLNDYNNSWSYMRLSHHETVPYNLLISLINYFKIINNCFKVISNHSKTMKSEYFKIASDHFNVISDHLR